MTPEEIKADKRLQRTYGITLAEYNQRLAAQNGGCAICHRPPSHIRLAVDHDHRFDRMKVNVYLDVDKRYYVADALPLVSPIGGFTDKKEARQEIKRRLRRLSIRGLLCINCNRGLQKFYDKPERFEAAALYLRRFLKCESGFRTNHS